MAGQAPVGSDPELNYSRNHRLPEVLLHCETLGFNLWPGRVVRERCPEGSGEQNKDAAVVPRDRLSLTHGADEKLPSLPLRT